MKIAVFTAIRNGETQSVNVIVPAMVVINHRVTEYLADTRLAWVHNHDGWCIIDCTVMDF